MSTTISDVDTLQEYLLGVMGKADHHGPHVNEVILTLIGAIVWCKDAHPITIRGTDGTTVPKVLWVHINSIRYAFSYSGHAVIMRRDSLQGPTVAEFTNRTPVEEIKSLFAFLNH